MKKKKRIWLWILLGIFFLSALLVFSQWDNINAVIDAFRYSQEEVVEKMEQNKQELQNYIDKNDDVNVRDLTKEEAEALNKGELTEDEVVDILVGKHEKVPAPEDESAPSKKPQQQNKQETAGQKVSEAIARLYVQKNACLSKLDVIEADANARFMQQAKKKSPDIQRSIKASIISEYLPKVASWEKECDSVVYGIINEIKVALKESGQSTEIADKIEQAYLDEKKLKKSYFIGRYMD